MSALQNALREAARREFENIPAENELDLAFSDSFQKRMEELISGYLDGNNAGKLPKRARSSGVIIENLAEL